ncbi:unnamed protein product [Caenorhabditis angaria]|uniref:Uncharacterized protein n=1 Tax=Caenorhabditis angaria TaxID=860376 RepID=A0A9P1IE78_9PELO|nr:unnamed protein product [Caenorhabditis angaria]
MDKISSKFEVLSKKGCLVSSPDDDITLEIKGTIPAGGSTTKIYGGILSNFGEMSDYRSMNFLLQHDCTDRGYYGARVHVGLYTRCLEAFLFCNVTFRQDITNMDGEYRSRGRAVHYNF